MDAARLFFQRYDVLCDFWLAGVWEAVPADLMRPRPHPRVNSIAWNLWHVARVEDAGLNRFVADRPQVLDEGRWAERMNAPWRHHGSGMSFAEVEDLSGRIDLPALRDYAAAVQARTREIVLSLTEAVLEETVSPERARAVVVDEGLGHSGAEELAQLYAGWSRARCLMNFGLTHPYQHVGEIGVIASLLGVEF